MGGCVRCRAGTRSLLSIARRCSTPKNAFPSSRLALTVFASRRCSHSRPWQRGGVCHRVGGLLPNLAGMSSRPDCPAATVQCAHRVHPPRGRDGRRSAGAGRRGDVQTPARARPLVPICRLALVGAPAAGAFGPLVALSGLPTWLGAMDLFGALTAMTAMGYPR
jgi:hypothetical protein